MRMLVCGDHRCQKGRVGSDLGRVGSPYQEPYGSRTLAGTTDNGLSATMTDKLALTKLSISFALGKSTIIRQEIVEDH